MKRATVFGKLASILLVAVLLLAGGCTGKASPTPTSLNSGTTSPVAPGGAGEVNVKLPEPRYSSRVSIEETLLKRRSIREYSKETLTLKDVSQLLWAAQGITTDWGGRTAPSAGATYPLEVYLVTGTVEGLAAGVYRYDPRKHALVRVKEGDVMGELSRAALGQTWVREAAINIAISAVYERTTDRYGDRGVRYIHMEAGHAAQNVCLQATALDMGSVVVGAFQDEQTKRVLGLPANEVPLYLIPVGKLKP